MKVLDRGNIAILILLDLSAAFDTVSHTLLIKRLRTLFGIRGNVLKWLESYLTSRHQCVSVEGILSDSTTLKFGVPQGSVLGPKLFCMYTRPLGSIIIEYDGVRYHIYADDSQLYVEVELKLESEPYLSIDRVQKCIEFIRNWMQENFLKLNEQKTEIIYFTSLHNRNKLNMLDLNITVGNDIVSPVPCVRNLGIYQDECLSMEQHASRVSRACFGVIHSLYRIRRYLTEDACKTLVRSLVFSKLHYGNALMCGATKKVTKSMQRVINVCARLVKKSPKRSHVTPLVVELHWLPMRERIDYKIILLTYKTLNGLCPQYMSGLLEETTTDRHLRSSRLSTLSIPKFRTERYGRGRFGVAAPMLWNSLPIDLKNCANVSTFKKQLKTYLFRKAYF